MYEHPDQVPALYRVRALIDNAVRAQNLVVMELCEGGSLLQVLQADNERRREYGWRASSQVVH